jgi:tetratricopeptide (TPR) repeat protein/V8-like Glu-specific endopeptidase
MMYRSSWFLTAALIGTTIALVQPVAVAKSFSEVEVIAKAVTVEIKLKNKGSNGSGVIFQKNGDLYTLVTNRHVICGASDCGSIPAGEVFILDLPNGQKYQVLNGAIKLLGSSDNIVDLAIIQFRSNRNYAVAKVAPPGSLKANDQLYTAGFPFKQPGFTFSEGKAIAVVNKRLTGDSGGYTIVYDALTLPGMSGGGVFDRNGQLVAIHGYGDRFRENTDLNDKSQVDSKMGYNRGIPVRWLVQNLAEAGINLGTDRSVSGIRAARSQAPTTADEYFIAGFNKLVEPGSNVVAGKKQAIGEFSAAIRLNPKYQFAYFLRAYVYEQVQEFQRALSDYNQAIFLNSKYPETYYNRAKLKKDKLNDIQGALADYNQAILLDPKFSDAYFNRANLKDDKLNDIQGALADYNQAILLNPKDSGFYNNRGILKYNKLNDIQGALSDFTQAILFNPKDSDAYNNRGVLKYGELNDIQGALADYNQAILLNPKDFNAYNNRGFFKDQKRNDVQGALADYNRSISLNPKYARAYGNRGLLKKNKLNDRAGAIQDFRQAARLLREQGNTQGLQLAIQALQELGATE